MSNKIIPEEDIHIGMLFRYYDGRGPKDFGVVAKKLRTDYYLCYYPFENMDCTFFKTLAKEMYYL